MRTPDQCGHLEINKYGETFSAAFINVTCFYSWRIWFKNFIEDERKNFENSTISKKRFRKVFVCQGRGWGTGGTGPPPSPPPPPHTHTHNFLQTKIFFLVVLPRFTSWNWLVWITFSSVLTMSQCFYIHMLPPSKHSPWWWRLQDILKTSCRDVFKTLSRRIIKL